MTTNWREKILIALFAALTAIGAFIRIPTPIVPYTLQFLFCAYAGIFLGSKNGACSQLLYIAIGLLGVPVFTGGGGPAYVLQPTFGYLIGFVICSYLVGKGCEGRQVVSYSRILAAVLAGLAAVYVCGVAYLYLIVNLYLAKPMAVEKALAVGFLPYIIPDVILSLLIAATAVRILPALRRAGYLRPEKEK